MGDDGTFGGYLTQAMDALDMSIADLKRLTGISDSIISKWRRDQAIPSVENLRILAPALGVTTRDLVVRAGHMLPEEVGLTEPPRPPEPYRRAATPQDDINALPGLTDRARKSMIDLYEQLATEIEQESGSE